MTLDLFTVIVYLAVFSGWLGIGGLIAWCLGYRD
jgi:hypothetical protein